MHGNSTSYRSERQREGYRSLMYIEETLTVNLHCVKEGLMIEGKVLLFVLFIYLFLLNVQFSSLKYIYN